MLLFCFKLSVCHFGHNRNTSVKRESKSYVFYSHVTSNNDIHICSNKHETGLVYCVDFLIFWAFWNIGPPGRKGWSEVIQMSLTFNDTFDENKEEGKDQDTIQSSTTTNSEHHMEKGPKHKKIYHTKRARLALSQGITRL